MHGVRLIREGLTYVALIALGRRAGGRGDRTVIVNGTSCPAR